MTINNRRFISIFIPGHFVHLLWSVRLKSTVICPLHIFLRSYCRIIDFLVLDCKKHYLQFPLSSPLSCFETGKELFMHGLDSGIVSAVSFSLNIAIKIFFETYKTLPDEASCYGCNCSFDKMMFSFSKKRSHLYLISLLLLF